MKISEATILIYDFGLNTNLSLHIAKKCKKVIYFCPWAEGFPEAFKFLITDGLEEYNVEHSTTFFDKIDRADLLIFPDTFCWDLATFLISKGYPVFGAGNAEVLENDRFFAKKKQKEFGLPMTSIYKTKGLKELESLFKDKGIKDCFLKLSGIRGSWETQYVKDYKMAKSFINDLSYTFNPLKDKIEFLVEQAVKGKAEIGIDTLCCDGVFPETTMYGFEVKSAGAIYLGKTDKYKNFPKVVTESTDKFSPLFKEYKCRSFLSSEIIIKDDKSGYLVEWSVRTPLPAVTPVMQELFSNLPEVIFSIGKYGKMLDLIPKAKYGVGVPISSDYAREHWVELDTQLPFEIFKPIKIIRVDKTNFSIPQYTTLGTVVAIGNSIDECIKKVGESLGKVDAPDCDKTIGGIDKIRKELETAKGLGINF